LGEKSMSLSDVDLKIAAIKKQQELLDAQKGLADSQASLALARNVGSVTQGPYAGAVTFNDKEGTEEAALLSARAVRQGAAVIADRLERAFKTRPSEKQGAVLLFEASEVPNFQRLREFYLRVDLLKQAFQTHAAERAHREGLESLTVGVVAAGIDAFSKILGYLKTDYQIGGVEAKVDASLLLCAVAGSLRQKGINALLPAVYYAAQESRSLKAIVGELAVLARMRTACAERRLTVGKLHPAGTREKLPNSGETAGAAGLPDKKRSAEMELDQLDATLALYDDFAASLSKPDGAGALTMLGSVVREQAMEDVLKDNGTLLLLRVENTGGGYLVKKNLWSGLGAMPVYNMGGATVSYLLLDGLTSTVIDADALPIFGGFVRSDRLERELVEDRK
jgi:hypothetical protein